MKFVSVEEILQFAIDREKDAVTFYSERSNEATSKSLKETFLGFSKEEEKHVDLLSDISGNRAKIDAYEFKKINDLKISDYLVEKDYEPGMPMPDVLRLAMKKEEKAVNLYTELAANTQDEDTKKVMLLLVQEESKHKLGLESMYDDFLAAQDS